VNEIENDATGREARICRSRSRSLNASSAPHYDVSLDRRRCSNRQVDALGSDAIKAAMIYSPGRVKPVGTTCTVLNARGRQQAADAAPRKRSAGRAGVRARDITADAFVVTPTTSRARARQVHRADASDGQATATACAPRRRRALATWARHRPDATSPPDVLIVVRPDRVTPRRPITRS
jgi:predicted extracellular nuclease